MRAANLLASLGLRTFPMPEASHGKWNDFKRTLDACDMKLSLLKGICLVNHGRGPFGSGRFRFQMEEAGNMLLEEKRDDPDFFRDLLLRVQYDTGIDFESECVDDPIELIREHWESALKHRIKEVSR